MIRFHEQDPFVGIQKGHPFESVLRDPDSLKGSGSSRIWDSSEKVHLYTVTLSGDAPEVTGSGSAGLEVPRESCIPGEVEASRSPGSCRWIRGIKFDGPDPNPSIGSGSGPSYPDLSVRSGSS